MKRLTNEEMLKLSDPALPKEVKNHVAMQKMTKDEITICRKMGVEPVEFLIQSEMDEF